METLAWRILQVGRKTRECIVSTSNNRKHNHQKMKEIKYLEEKGCQTFTWEHMRHAESSNKINQHGGDYIRVHDLGIAWDRRKKLGLTIGMEHEKKSGRQERFEDGPAVRIFDLRAQHNVMHVR